MSFQRIRPGYESSETMHFRVLTDEQCEQIIASAAGILAECGVEVQDDEILSMMKFAGCSITENRVRIPEQVLREALDSVPSEITIYDQLGNKAMDVRGRNSYFAPGLCNTFVYDETLGERRPTVLRDLQDVAVLCDSLPNIDYVYGMGGASDCSPAIQDVYEMYTLLRYTNKPVAGWNCSLAGCRETLDLLSAVAGSVEALQKKPFAIMYAGNPITPFVHPKEYLKKLRFWVENQIPVLYPTSTQLGINGPVTIAGALTIAMADNLAGIVISQIIKKGAPIFGNTYCISVDMRNVHACYGAPETGLAQAAQADLHHYLAIPTWGMCGCTDSKVFDEQCCLEATLGIVWNYLSGNNALHDLGFLEAGILGSKELLVFCDEVLGYVKRFAKGIEVNEETIAAELIKEIGPKGSYILEDHTLDNFRDEIFTSDLVDHNHYQAWKANGSKTMGDRIREKTQRLLLSSRPKDLSKDVIDKLDDVLLRAKARAEKNIL